MAIKRNRRFIEIIAERHAMQERKDERQSMAAFWLALPLAIVQLWII